MVRAIRVITVEQGNDPRHFSLFAFGVQDRCWRPRWRKNSE